MTKQDLYHKLHQAFNKHIINDTTNITFVNNVIKLVKQYLKDKNNE